MRRLSAITCLGLMWLAFAPLPAWGQYELPRADERSYYSPPRPISVEEPQPLLPAAKLEARPLDADPPVYSPHLSPQADRSPFPVRLARAEETVERVPHELEDGDRATPLRLSPRSERASDGIAKHEPPTPADAIGTVAGSLGIVLGLFLAIVWISRRFSPAGTGLLPKEAVELLGRAPLAGRQQVQLVRVGNKLVLVALSPAGCETLTEVTDPAEVEHLLALCRRTRPGSSTAAFSQVLGQLASEPSRGGFAGSTRRGSRGGS